MKAEQKIDVTDDMIDFFCMNNGRLNVGTLPGLAFKTKTNTVESTRIVHDSDCRGPYEYTEKNRLDSGQVKYAKRKSLGEGVVGLLVTKKGTIKVTPQSLNNLQFSADNMDPSKKEIELRQQIEQTSPFLHTKPANLIDINEEDNFITVGSNDPLFDPVTYTTDRDYDQENILNGAILEELSVIRQNKGLLVAMLAIKTDTYSGSPVVELPNINLNRLVFFIKEAKKPTGIDKLESLLYKMNFLAAADNPDIELLKKYLLETNKEIIKINKKLTLRAEQDYTGEPYHTISGKYYSRNRIDNLEFIPYRIYDTFTFNKIIFDEKTKSLFAVDTETKEARDLRNKVLSRF